MRVERLRSCETASMSTPTRTFRRRIGEILVNDGVVTQEQVEEALAIQKKSREPLGSILLEMGAVTESDISRTICIQYQLPFICFANYEMDEKLVQLLPKELLHQQRMLPFDKIGSILLAAVAEVPDESVLAEIAKQTKLSVALYVGYTSEITKELARLCPCDVKIRPKAGALPELDIDSENDLETELVVGETDGDADDEDSSTLAFGAGKGSFLQELDSTWDSIFETSKGQGGKK